MAFDGVRHPKKNGVYLVVIDTTEEGISAVRHAAEFANVSGGYVALLNVMEQVHVQNWMDVEHLIRKEMRTEAEQGIWEASGIVKAETGKIPMVFIEEGTRSDRIVDIIDGNPNIVSLVLAASASSNPGPLVTYFTGKGLHRLNVPLVIVPHSVEES